MNTLETPVNEAVEKLAREDSCQAARNGMLAFSKFRNVDGFSEKTVLVCLDTPFMRLALEGMSSN